MTNTYDEIKKAIECFNEHGRSTDDLQDNFMSIWNDAYKSGSLNALKSLLNVYKSFPDDMNKESAISFLKVIIDEADKDK